MHPAEYSTRLLLDIRLRLVDTPVIGYWAKEVTLQLKSPLKGTQTPKLILSPLSSPLEAWTDEEGIPHLIIRCCLNIEHSAQPLPC